MLESSYSTDLTSIAVVGMSCRFPGANSVNAFWQNLATGIESIKTIPDEEIVQVGVSRKTAHPNYVKRGSYIDGVELFDANFFDLTPREASITAPSQRWLLVCAYEALEDAGYSTKNHTGRVGVFAGTNRCDEWQKRLYNLSVEVTEEFAKQLQLFIASDVDYGTTRISYKLNLTGPSININTACSTSLVAISQACKSLLAYECDMALAGGSNIVVPQKSGYLYEEGGMQSKDGCCRTFDAKAQGTIFGNGAGMVLLKRLEEAKADRDNIYAIIRGSAVNNDGSAKVGYTAPSVSGQAQVISDALAFAEISPLSVGCIEAHGTATAMGDPIEIEALSKVFKEATDKKNYCAIGSVKTNLGHLGSAAGVAGFIKAVMVLKHKQIPSSLHYELPNPEIDFENSPFFVNTKLRPWKTDGTPRKMGVSSFGVGGTNAHVVLEDFQAAKAVFPSRDWQLIMLSAKNEAALKTMRENLAQHLQNNPQLNLADVAYTLQVGREAFQYRQLWVCSSLDDAVSSLLKKQGVTGVLEEKTPLKIAFMFPGQGAQIINMMSDLYQKEEIFRNQVDYCAKILIPLLGEDLRDILYPKKEDAEAAASKLIQTHLVQPALFVVEYALVHLWQSWGIYPDKMIGHSIGEYVAACLAGVFSLDECLDLVVTRGRLMQSMPAGVMLGVSLSEKKLLPLLNKHCSLAAVNAADWTVVSGPEEAVQLLQQQLTEQGIDTRPLHTSHAFHSAMMDPILDEFQQKVSQLTLSTPTTPFISNLTGTWITDAQATDPVYWAKQLRGTVRFHAGSQKLLEDNNTLLLEVGPGQTLTRLLDPGKQQANRVLSSCRLPKQQVDDQAFLLETLGRLWLGGIQIDWTNFYQNEQRYRVSLPTYPFQGERYWLESSGQQFSSQVVVQLPGFDEMNQLQETVSDVLSNVASPEKRRKVLQDSVRDHLSKLFGIENVDEHVPFIELGMSSLMAIELKTQLQNQLAVEDISVVMLLAEDTTVETLADYLWQQSAGNIQVPSEPAGITLADSTRERHVESLEPPDVSEKDNKGSGDTAESLPTIVADPANKGVPFPLTDIQQAYWIGRDSTFEGGNVATYGYIETDVHNLDVNTFQAALNQLIQRHDMLRMVVLPDGTQQFLQQVSPYKITYRDLSQVAEQEKQQQLNAVREQMSHQVFATDQWPLFELRISKMDQDIYRIHIGIDFLIADVLSLRIFLKDIYMIYVGETAILPLLEISFRDYVLAEQASRQSSLYQISEAYWLARVTLLPPAPLLPKVKEPTQISTPRFQRREAYLDRKLWSALTEKAKRYKITPSVLVANTFAEVVSKWSKSAHFTLNLTIFNRLNLHPQVNDLMGDFTSSILLEVDLSERKTFSDNARQLQRQLLNDLEHRYFSGIGMLRAMNSQLGSHQAVIMPIVLTSALGMGNYIEGYFEGLDDEKRAIYEEIRELGYSISQTSQVWLDHVVMEKDGGLSYTWDFLEELFPDKLLDDLFAAYNKLLYRLAEEDSKAWELPTDVELPAYQLAQRQLTNQNQVPISEALLHGLFQQKVKQQPEHTAVISPQTTLSYQELHRLSSSLGYQLRGKGTQPNKLVAVVMEKGWEQVVAVLGVLYSGAAYLPIEASLPQDRILLLLEQGEVNIAITQPQFEDQLKWPQKLQVISLEREKLQQTAPVELDSTQNSNDLAYVIFTSGSTGVPKGVMIDHQGAVNTIVDINRKFDVSAKDKVLAVSSLSFDLSVYDIFGLLAAGGAIVIPEAAKEKDPQHWAEMVSQEGVTVWNTVPALAQLYIDQLQESGNDVGTKATYAGHLRLLMMSGDWIPLSLPEQIKKYFPHAKIISLGGATEASIWSIYYPIEALDKHWNSIPYGKPLANQTFHVLKNDLSPCPDWVVGDLYIGGIGLAKGYWRDVKKTESRFIFNPVSGERLYKTGDLGRYREDGNIEFLGREDNQVKVHGHRIELGEIESVLQQHPAIKDTVVITVGEQRNRQRLVAYVTEEKGENEPVFGRDYERKMVEQYDMLLDPYERAVFKLKQLGVRQFNSNETIISLQGKPDKDGSFRIIASYNNAAPTFLNAPIGLDKLGHWLSCLGHMMVMDNPMPKYTYPSAGSLHPIQVYLYIRANRIADMMGGFYYYDPAHHSFVLLKEDILSNGDELSFQRIEVELGNGGFGLFLVADKAAIEPIYANWTSRFCLIEMGHIIHLLTTTAPMHGIGLTKIDAEIFGPLEASLKLDKKHDYMQCFLGGITPESTPSYLSLSYLERQSYREFLSETVQGELLEELLLVLNNAANELTVAIGKDSSVADLLDIYIYIKSQRVSGLAGGFYRYFPMEGYLAELCPVEVLKEDLHGEGGNREIYEQSAFSLYFVGDAEQSESLLLAGSYGQALMHLAPKQEIGLCPIGGMDFDRIRPFLQLSSDAQLLYSFEGGRISEEQTQRWPMQLIPAKTDESKQWRDYCQQKLPYYMVPTEFITLETLPLSANGKVNREALLTHYQTHHQGQKQTRISGPRNSVEKRVLELWQEQIDLEQLGIEDNFFEVGGNSLIAVQVIAKIRKVFSIEIPLRQIFEHPTIEGMAKYIAAQEPAPELEQPMAPVLSLSDSQAKPQRMVAIETKGSGKPYFFVHPVGGQCIYYIDLASQLDRPTYGFQLLSIEKDDQSVTGMANLASYYIEEMRRVQLHGPYTLGGWSIGATVAFEMAGQLELIGETVDHIVMIDGPPPFKHEGVGDKRLLQWFLESLDLELPLAVLDQMDLSGLTDSEQISHAIELLCAEGDFALDLTQLLPIFRVFKTMLRIAQNYQPPNINVDVLVLRAADGVVTEFAKHPYGNQDDWGWGLLTSGHVQCERLPGTHYSLLAEPHVDAVATVMNSRLVRK